MCSKISCPNCGKPTWQGCGEHIDDALRGVAAEDRCSCPRDLSQWTPQPNALGSQPGSGLGGMSVGSW